MSEQQLELVRRAEARYGKIFPCSGRSKWSECFTQYREKAILWFNSSDNSTHIETEYREP